ncbi:MAG: alkene reductase [Arachidicoccus sp.]|nr:alkene reductase [Arachidicoccus sp.]
MQSKIITLLTPYSKGNLDLKNHLVMAPMTRSRAVNNLPNDLMAEYYGQRTGAGLIITEGTAPSPDALGYARIPGIFSKPQIEGWKKTTAAVHKDGTKIFLQIMHTGRMGHFHNLPAGAMLVGASSIKATGQIQTDINGLQDFSTPKALTIKEVEAVVQGYVNAAKNAMATGFDGIELHGANGYLLEQFLNPNVNNRTDAYGGNIKNRTRLTLEVAEKTVTTIGNNKVGIRLSPFSKTGDLQPYDESEVHDTYAFLATELNKMKVAYIHIVLNPLIPQATIDAIRSNFDGTIIKAGGFTPETAEQALVNGSADLAAFGKAFLANPDFDKRIETGAALNPVDFKTLYATPDAIGYTDYPTLQK